MQAAVDATGGAGPRALLVWAHGVAGDEPVAREQFDRLTADAGVEEIPLDRLWLAYLGIGDTQRAIEALETAADRRLVGVTELGQSPDADPLRSHPRFVALMDRIGIPESARVDP